MSGHDHPRKAKVDAAKVSVSPEHRQVFLSVLKAAIVILGAVGSFIGIARFLGFLVAALIGQTTVIVVMAYYLYRLQKTHSQTAEMSPDLPPSNRVTDLLVRAKDPRRFERDVLYEQILGYHIVYPDKIAIYKRLTGISNQVPFLQSVRLWLSTGSRQEFHDVGFRAMDTQWSRRLEAKLVRDDEYWKEVEVYFLRPLERNEGFSFEYTYVWPIGIRKQEYWFVDLEMFGGDFKQCLWTFCFVDIALARYQLSKMLEHRDDSFVDQPRMVCKDELWVPLGGERPSLVDLELGRVRDVLKWEVNGRGQSVIGHKYKLDCIIDLPAVSAATRRA